jgi:hypothetical protein
MGSPEAQNMFLTYSKFVKSLMRIIHGDLLILKLLIMLSLFSADRPGLYQQDKIEEMQECYANPILAARSLIDDISNPIL